MEVFGTDIDKDFSKVKYYIGVVPQEFNFGFFEKVIDIVVGQAGYYGIPKEKALPIAKDVLERLGLGDKMEVQARTLSGGMKRRLMIARALVHEPKILILDEPTAGVDAQLRIGMWDYLKKINKEKGVTILLTTHYLEEVEQLCDRAAIIRAGEIVKLDTVKNLLNSLDEEEYTIDIKQSAVPLAQAIKKAPYKISVTDKEDLEVTLKKTDNLNELVMYLDSVGVITQSIRPKGNRLETLFLNIIK